ncbi:MAG: type I-F CRISPR-associated endonuclease Cas1f [Geovibrio sp.]|nr:type I-F CRISPR-associated endonuclease Cas1f [Geovibrio sp.]
MKTFTPSEMKTILISKRANLYYLEHCRVLVNGGRVEYVVEKGKESHYYNIPIANTTVILLGSGTSLTQAAVRELSKAGVMVGFCGGGGTPLFSAMEMNTDIVWFSPQSEYRPTEYLQAWAKFWFDDTLRLEAAKMFQTARIDLIGKKWLNSRFFDEKRFDINETMLKRALGQISNEIKGAKNTEELLSSEAKLTKQLYKLAAEASGFGDFTRAKRGSGTDMANRFLDHGNYLAYGLGATVAWVLGLPHGFAVLHGKTRRGGLVFDIADLIKDSLILPLAFISARDGDDERMFRQGCIDSLVQNECLDFMIDTVKDVALEMKSRCQ